MPKIVCQHTVPQMLTLYTTFQCVIGAIYSYLNIILQYYNMTDILKARKKNVRALPSMKNIKGCSRFGEKIN